MSGRQKPGEPAAKHVSPHLPLGKPLAGDLEVVRRGLVHEKSQVSKLREDQRLRDLVVFCCSEEYTRLREKLGLSCVVSS